MTILLHEYLSRQADKNPHATAVVMKQQAKTYGQMEVLSNQLARMLRSLGCRAGDRICVLMPKSISAIVSLLGIYKADGVFVPLDPTSPASRLLKMIETSGARWILGAGAIREQLGEIMAGTGPSLSLGWMDEEADPDVPKAFSETDLNSFPGERVEPRNTDQSPAHILFTSGSTGTPKGVIITHSNVVHFVDWAKSYFALDASDRNSCHSPLHFDLSTFDVFGTFAAGAELHLVPPELNLLPRDLADFIRHNELTQWFSVPSALNLMAKFGVVRSRDFPALRRVLWCGEVFPTPSLMYWMKRLPHTSFTNLYGPTEATIASSYYTVPQCPENDNFQIPIGRPCEGEELLVLDADLAPVPAEEIGDLYIRGVGLSPGYWEDPEKTRTAFIHTSREGRAAERIYKTGDLAMIGKDGLVYFAGRSDTQIKSRGYRIELGEIEAALNTLGELQECAVVAFATDGFEGNKICCVYVPLPGREVSPSSLRKALSRHLPGYMLPSIWSEVDRLPKNGNGKVDRPHLVERLRHRDTSAEV